MNVLYDVVKKSGCDYATVREALISDPRIGETHTEPVHDSGRGAGGHCFIKDFEAFRRYYNELFENDSQAKKMLAAMVAYNEHLLRSTSKDLDLLEGVYGQKSDLK